MTPALAALTRAQLRLIERLEQLDARLDAGDEFAWSALCEAAATLAAIVSHTAPGANGEFLTTAELAERLHITPKTLLRRRARGQVKAVQFAKRDPKALLWQA